MLETGYVGLLPGLGHDDEVEAGRQIVANPAECLANEAFSSVTLNRPSDPLADGNAEACPALIVDGGVKSDPLVRQTMTKPQNADELAARSDTHGAWQGVSWASLGHDGDYTGS